MAGSRVREQCIVGPTHVAERMAFFLVRTPVFGRHGLELREYFQRRLKIGFITPAHGAHVKRLGILGVCLQNVSQVGQCIIKPFGNNFVLNRFDCL